MGVERFEDLEIWKLSRELVKFIYSMTANMKLTKDYGFVSQIQRSSVSIMSNISEGFERKGNKEFIHFLYIAKGSCGELRSQLYIALDLDYIAKDDFQNNLVLAERISKSITALIKYLDSYNSNLTPKT
jgi:four helix bundle protein